MKKWRVRISPATASYKKLPILDRSADRIQSRSQIEQSLSARRVRSLLEALHQVVGRARLIIKRRLHRELRHTNPLRQLEQRRLITPLASSAAVRVARISGSVAFRKSRMQKLAV